MTTTDRCGQYKRVNRRLTDDLADVAVCLAARPQSHVHWAAEALALDDARRDARDVYRHLVAAYVAEVRR